jgi:hypothetical protein
MDILKVWQANEHNRVCEGLLQQALDKSEFADVRFEVAGQWVASGHRSVLCTASPVFRNMFANDTEEKNTGIIKLDDVSPDGILAFLHLVYTGGPTMHVYMPKPNVPSLGSVVGCSLWKIDGHNHQPSPSMQKKSLC